MNTLPYIFFGLLLLSAGTGIAQSGISRKSVTVPARLARPYATGVSVKQGDYVFVAAAGTVHLGFWTRNQSAEGLADPIYKARFNKKEYANLNHGALLARVNGQIHSCQEYFNVTRYDYTEGLYIKNIALESPGTCFIAKTSGYLELDLNDNEWQNNQGEFEVFILVMDWTAHMNRNQFNRCPRRMPRNDVFDLHVKTDTYVDEHGNTWERDIHTEGKYHCGNATFRGTATYEHCQCSYNATSGVLVNEGGCQGTYDYAPHTDSRMHYILDVLPHNEYARYLVRPYVYSPTPAKNLF